MIYLPQLRLSASSTWFPTEEFQTAGNHIATERFFRLMRGRSWWPQGLIGRVTASSYIDTEAHEEGRRRITGADYMRMP